MLRLARLGAGGRLYRADDAHTLGTPTLTHLERALEAGDRAAVEGLLACLGTEGKSLHDLMCDWVWDLLTRIAERDGEQAMYEMLRASQGGWMLRRTWKAFLALPVSERVALTAEIMRAHRCGPRQDGTIEVTEDERCWRIRMDPCGSGGRMRRGDPVDGTPSRLGAPYRFGVTKAAYPWCWGLRGVPYYCVHCAVNELLPIEWGGHPLWVTEFDPDPGRPCAWVFYKRAEDIPPPCYRRLGREKPAPGEGRY